MKVGALRKRTDVPFVKYTTGTTKIIAHLISSA